MSDPLAIANHFCKYSSNIGPNLAAKIAPSSANYEDFLISPSHQRLEFQPLTDDELKEIVQTFAINEATGVDNISMGIIKLAIDDIDEPFTEIINFSNRE